MIPSRQLFLLAKGVQLGVLCSRLPIPKNVFLSSICGQRTISNNANSLNAVKVDRNGSLKEDLKVLDESGKELGVMKKNRLKLIATERNMRAVCIDENAVPHPIYKLETLKAKKDVEKKRPEKPERVKSKSLSLNSTISKNDLSIKIENLLEWLKKNFTVNVKIQFQPEDKKYLEVYKEIVNATSSIATLTEARTMAQSMTFNLVLSEKIVKPSSPPKPLTIEELKGAQSSTKAESVPEKLTKVKESKQEKKMPEETAAKTKSKTKAVKPKNEAQ